MQVHSMAPSKRVRYLAAVVVAGLSFFGAYAFAASSQRGEVARGAGDGYTLADVGAASGASCACCGGGSPTGEPIVGEAVVEGGVQRIGVDVTGGYYAPDTIVLRAGVPAEIEFSQSSGCTAQVMSRDLGFLEDLSSGPRTVRLPALEAGEYGFSCGMQMVFGKVVVE